MNRYDEEFKDYDAWEPAGTDSTLRRDTDGRLYYFHRGSWYGVNNPQNLPNEVRAAWMAEEMRRHRLGKEKL